jgi:hypothetical protein
MQYGFDQVNDDAGEGRGASLHDRSILVRHHRIVIASDFRVLLFGRPAACHSLKSPDADFLTVLHDDGSDHCRPSVRAGLPCRLRGSGNQIVPTYATKAISHMRRDSIPAAEMFSLDQSHSEASDRTTAGGRTIQNQTLWSQQLPPPGLLSLNRERPAVSRAEVDH